MFGLSQNVKNLYPSRKVYDRMVFDMKTGKRKIEEQKAREYRGPFAGLMPNSHPKSVKSLGELQQAITPISAGLGERIPWVWYHRQTYTDNSTVSLDFFNETGTVTDTNFQAANQIPAPMYFELYHIGIYFDLAVSLEDTTGTGSAGGSLNDLIGLMDGIFTLNMAQKVYYQAPIFTLPAGGGASGVIAMAETLTAADGHVLQQGTNGVPDLRNRANLWGDIIIPHNQFIGANLTWAAAVNTQIGNVDIYVYLDGYLYRRVL